MPKICVKKLHQHSDAKMTIQNKKASFSNKKSSFSKKEVLKNDAYEWRQQQLYFNWIRQLLLDHLKMFKTALTSLLLTKRKN